MKSYGTCHYCGQQIWTMQCKVKTTKSGAVQRYHFNPITKLDCLSDENRAYNIMRKMEDDQ